MVLTGSVLRCRGNTLHGGFNPLFENSTWDVLESSGNHVKLHFTSPEGAQVLCYADSQHLQDGCRCHNEGIPISSRYMQSLSGR